MAKRSFPLVVSYKNLVKHLQSTTPKAPIVTINRLFISNSNAHAHVHTQGGDSIVGETTEVEENVGEMAKGKDDTGLDEAVKTTETIVTAEADTNVVDTVEYRCSEDLGGQLGDGHDVM